MADVVSIELLLDEAADARVREEWAALAAAGLSSLGAHTAPSNAPHITLAVRPAMPEFALSDEVRALLPVPVTLGAPMLFGTGDRRVLVRSVLGGLPLLHLHAALHAALPAALPAAEPAVDAPHTRPGEWTPHVTLARRLKLDDLPRALALLGADIPAAAVSMRRWDSAALRVTPF
jgi:2'-5' RNA ligase